MQAELGKIEKPEAESFKQERKLFLVPLIYSDKDAPTEYQERYERYWEGVIQHITNLETKLGKVNRVYHEALSLSGEDGLKIVEKLNLKSHRIIADKCSEGANLESTEDQDIAEESFDWQRCLMVGLTSEKVANKVYEFFIESTRKRYEFISKKINETLQPGETGLIFIREDHRIQFPNDVQVFHIAPPALDEIHRWLRSQAEKKD